MIPADLAARVLDVATRVLADVPPIEPPVQRTSLLPLALAGLLLAAGVVTLLVRLQRARRAPRDQA